MKLTEKDERRFWVKVGLPDPETGCMEWTASKPRGYGNFGLNGQVLRAHRISYSLCVGPIPQGLEIDHLCRNRSCVRPDHLEAVTHSENMRRVARSMMVDINDLLARTKLDETTECLLWTGGTAAGNDGKGKWPKIYTDGSSLYAHRLAYQLTYGAIPEGKQIKHRCGTRLCINPEHLMAITYSTKTYLRVNNYPDHCPQGHPFAGQNLVRDSRGTRRCRTCRRAQVAASNRKLRAAKKEA